MTISSAATGHPLNLPDFLKRVFNAKLKGQAVFVHDGDMCCVSCSGTLKTPVVVNETWVNPICGTSSGIFFCLKCSCHAKYTDADTD